MDERQPCFPLSAFYRSPPQSIESKEKTPLLTIENVSVHIPAGTILSITGTLAIPAGSRVAVLGENGAGKTTLLNCILGRQRHSGTITPKIKPSDAGIVLQKNNYAEFIRTDELIQLVIHDSKKSRKYQELLDDFKLRSFERKMVNALSGGENQRLTLALALNMPKEFYFFDEISSGLDYQNRQELAYIIQEKTGNATVLSVSHYFEEIQGWATHVLLLHCGKPKYFGTSQGFYETYPHDAVLEFPGPVERFLDKPLIKNYRYSDNMIFLPGNKEKDTLAATLAAKNIPYKTSVQNLASTYSYALGTNNNHSTEKTTNGTISTDITHRH